MTATKTSWITALARLYNDNMQQSDPHKRVHRLDLTHAQFDDFAAELNVKFGAWKLPVAGQVEIHGIVVRSVDPELPYDD